MIAHPQWRTSFESQRVEGVPSGLVLFDGVCALCSGWVQFILARDPDARFQFASIQGASGAALAARMGINPDDPATNAVVLDGIAYFKSDSALEVLSRLAGWRWTQLLRVVPRAVRDWVYDRIARNRYAIYGRTERCFVPTAEQRSRFLDPRER